MENLTSPYAEDGRQFSLIVVERFEEIPARLQMTSSCFALLAAMDFTGDSPDMRDAIERLIDNGLVFFSSWGTGCEALHDLVDRVDMDSGHFDPNASFDDVLMTVWNSKRTLEETMWDFANAPCIAGRYVDDCKRFFIATESRYAERVRNGWTLATLAK